ncbi:MAG: hypothetical protein JRI23_34310 [Deltaproteobacteria bacterium]|nr:hypothetical protein [Deltaproteobacteria bacterium]MBW2537372.1 hypothetical protein [Deltaproteobacteria bacterium]
MNRRVVESMVRSILMALAVALIASAASGGESVSAAEKDTARRAMDRGDTLVRDGKLDEALEAYRVADDIMGVPTTGLEVGKTLLRLGKLVEARDVLLRVTRFPREKGEPEPFTTARAMAVGLADSLQERIPTVALDIQGTDVGATIYVSVDGKRLPKGAHAIPLSMNPGRHTVEVLATPNLGGALEVDLSEGAKQSRTVVLQPGATMPDDVGVQAGREDPPAAADAAEEEPLDPAMVTLVVGITAAGVGAVVGAVCTGLHYSAKGDLDDTYACAERDGACIVPEGDPNEPEKFDSLLSEAKTFSAVATAGWILAGVGASVAVVGAVLLGGKDEPEDDRLGVRIHPVTIEPVLGVGYAGLRGAF